MRVKSASVKWRLLGQRAMVKSNCEAIKSELNRRVSPRTKRGEKPEDDRGDVIPSGTSLAPGLETSGPRDSIMLCPTIAEGCVSRYVGVNSCVRQGRYIPRVFAFH